MKNIVRLFGTLFQIIFPIKLLKCLRSIKRHFHTGYYSMEFKHLGKNTSLNYPFHMVGGKYISLGNNVTIGKRGCITAWNTKNSNKPEIVVGNNVSIGDDCHITASNKIILGDNILVGKKVTITDNSHGIMSSKDELTLHPSKRTIFSKGVVIIHDRVWIGDKVTILPDIIIGEASIIGANSVVTNNIPSQSVAAGVPAKVIKRIH